MVGHGRKAYRITEDLVDRVDVTGGTVLFAGNKNGTFQVEFRHDLAGCGNPNSGVFVALLDFIDWTQITMQFSLLGTAACWSFNHAGGSGSGVGNNATGNLLAFNSSIDSVSRCYLTFEQPEFTLKTSACDNNPDNFFRFNGTVFKKFSMTRRRNINGLLAGPHHGRSCNQIGAGALTIINNIFVW